MTDVLDTLKQADPADLDRLRAENPPQEVLEAILATDRSRADGARRKRGRLLLATSGAALACALAVLLLAGGNGRSVDSAAAAALEQLADVARAQPPTLAPGDNRFLYYRLETKGFLAMASEPPFHRGMRTPDDFGFLLDFRGTQEVWAGDERGLVRNRSDTPTFASQDDRVAWEAAGRPKLPPASDFESPLQSIERLDLPTDPDALLESLERRAGDEHQNDSWIFSQLIADYLREWGITPEQRAALFGAAARVPGVELLGSRTDPAGRAGVGFAMRDERDHMRYTLIVDRDTGELLAQLWETVPGGPIPAGAKGYTVFRSPVLVDTIGERP